MDKPRSIMYDPQARLDAERRSRREYYADLDDALRRKASRMATDEFVANSGVLEPSTVPDRPRDKIARFMLGESPSRTRREFVEGLVGSTGVGDTDRLFSAADVLPVDVLGVGDALAEGDVPGAFLSLGLPASTKARKVMKGFAGGGLARKGAKAVEDLIGGLDQKAIKKAEEAVDKGLEMGGSRWDNTSQLRERFIREMGLEEGEVAFQRYMSSTAAAPPQPLKGADDPYLISPRMPTGKTAPEKPFEDYLDIDTRAMRADPDLFSHNVGLIRKYPVGLPEELLRDGSDDEVADAYRGLSARNLMFLHDKMPPGQRERAKLWYDGAHAIASRRAEQHGLPVQSVSGVYAALSPQKDWFQNVSLGDRVMDIYLKPEGRSFGGDMEATARRLFPDDGSAVLIDRLRGARLRDLDDPTAKALWLRAYDQTYNTPDYRIVSPEGEYLDFATTADGSRRKAAWGSLGEIGKAISSIESGGDMRRLSELMGERHKVRSFFNNIVAPGSRAGALTGDTHAVAAQQLRPLSGNSAAVAHNFKNSLDKGKQSDDWVAAKGSSKTGVQGTYGLNADGYRDAAVEGGRLPREMQSITWEGVRGLFPPRFKTEANLAAIDDVWRQVQRGRISEDEARERIFDLAGGMREPDWHGGD